MMEISWFVIEHNKKDWFKSFGLVLGNITLLTLPMLRLILSSKAKGHKDFWKSSKTFHVGIHLIALTEYSQMSTHLPGFQVFASFLHYFVLAKLATSSILGFKCFWKFASIRKISSNIFGLLVYRQEGVNSRLLVSGWMLPSALLPYQYQLMEYQLRWSESNIISPSPKTAAKSLLNSYDAGGYFQSKHKNAKIFKKTSKPVMVVFIG